MTKRIINLWALGKEFLNKGRSNMLNSLAVSEIILSTKG